MSTDEREPIALGVKCLTPAIHACAGLRARDRPVRMVLRARGSAPIAPSQLLLGVDPLENAGNLNFGPNRAAARCGDAAG